eukprot:1037617-Pelagomonas_calceolata.AAC.3
MEIGVMERGSWTHGLAAAAAAAAADQPQGCSDNLQEAHHGDDERGRRRCKPARGTLEARI